MRAVGEEFLKMRHYRAVITAVAICLSNLALALPLAPPPSGQWLRGDLHVHDDHSSDGSLPRQCCDDQGPGNTGIKDQILIAYLTGLQFLPLTDHRTYDQHYDPNWESANLLLIPGEEANGSPHATVHGAVESIVQGANPPNAATYARLQQSIWEAHAQDANWVTAHPDDGETNDDGSPNANASAVGIDLIEVWNRGSQIDKQMAYAENRWNAGYRAGVAGASDNHFRELWPLAGPGMPVTHVFAAQQRSRAVVEALRAGRTTLSSDVAAPLLTITADVNRDGIFETLPGDEVFVAPGTAVEMKATIEAGLGATILIYQAPGKSAGPLATFGPVLLPKADYRFRVYAGATPTWLRAEARGPGLPSHYDISEPPLSLVPDPQVLPDQLRAATSPIFISTGLVHVTPEIALPADQGTGDGATHALGDAGQFNGFPDVAVSGTTTHVVAERHVNGESRIWYRRRVNGTWSAPLQLAPLHVAARFPKVAARGADVWVAWQSEYNDELPHRPAIFLRRSTDHGATWQATQVIRSIAGRCEHPALAITADGKPILAWQEISAGHPFDVKAQIIGRDAAPRNLSWDTDHPKGQVLPALPTDTRSARYPASVWPSIAVAQDGRIAVAWQDNRTDPDPLWTGRILDGEGTDPDNWQVMVRLRGPGAIHWNRSSSLGADDRADRHPSIAFAADGSLSAAWTSKTLQSSGVNVAVMSSRTTDGYNWGAPAAIGFNANAMSVWPKLARAADGRVRAAWHDSRSADWRWRVATAKQGANGIWGAAQLLSGRGINTWPALSGNALVFASTRNALRLQRDRTQQIFALDLP
jgi:predicted metal-dependent phosphoesterase TrpH